MPLKLMMDDISLLASQSTYKHVTQVPVQLMMDDISATGWYYGSDGVRSPLDRYREPFVDPPYEGP
jgi:hypothetical protein